MYMPLHRKYLGDLIDSSFEPNKDILIDDEQVNVNTENVLDLNQDKN